MPIISKLNAMLAHYVQRFTRFAEELDERTRAGEFGKYPWQKDYGLWPWQRKRKRSVR